MRVEAFAFSTSAVRNKNNGFYANICENFSTFAELTCSYLISNFSYALSFTKRSKEKISLLYIF